MTESDGIRVVVHAERAWAPTVADVESAKRRSEAARVAAIAARIKVRERRSRDAVAARKGRDAARENDAVATLARAGGDAVLATLASRGAACERSNARVAAARADVGAARHVACAVKRHDKRHDAARQDACDAIKRNADRVAFCRGMLDVAERMPQGTRAERRARRCALHNAAQRLRNAAG